MREEFESEPIHFNELTVEKFVAAFTASGFKNPDAVRWGTKTDRQTNEVRIYFWGNK